MNLPGVEKLRFSKALPVWPEGRERRMNDFVEFRVQFEGADSHPVLRIAGCSVYRIRLNGDFVGYGPARAAKSFFRMDEWPLPVKRGANLLTVEVSAYNCNNYYYPEHPAFLQAEVVEQDGRIVAATGADGSQCAGFAAYDTCRIPKSPRYSFQRGFTEAYRKPGAPGTHEPLPLAVQPDVPILERIAPYPKFEIITLGEPVATTDVAWLEPESFYSVSWVDATQPWFKSYPVSELEANIWHDLQCIQARRGECTDCGEVASRRGRESRIKPGTGFLYDAGINATGFVALDVECRSPGTLWLFFSETLVDGMVRPGQFGCCNGVCFELSPGCHLLETFEPYTFRHLHVCSLNGDFDIACASVRTYRSPAADGAVFCSSDPAIDRIFAAARETFAQNAVDVFTDCPSRERAGWLCDSFFTGRAAALLTGSTELERLFLQNYILPERFEDIPDGMLPMCYPADHPNGNFIPNWAMWLVLETAEYLGRGGDRATIDALKPRFEKLVGYLRTFRNSDGLLEKLPSWVFVEWSKANDCVQDVNYPSNATWAAVLDAMDSMYSMPALAEEARSVREAIRRQAWNGHWFRDNAVRGGDGALVPAENFTETCQYYMFFFGVATPESHPALWRTLLEDFGPNRAETGKYPEIAPSNAFIGNFLRLDLLSRAGLGRQLIDETKGYFGYMAERTGTLWENITPSASCNHGFASHVAVFYLRNILGLKAPGCVTAETKIEPPADIPIDWCEVTLPTADGGVSKLGWKR